MTISELIERLKEFPPDMPVVKRIRHDARATWATMDGCWFQTVEIVRVDNPACMEPYYREPSRSLATRIDAEDAITALEL